MKSHGIRVSATTVCAIALLCGADRLYGDLIVVDDPQYGASSILQDTSTGLEWLNLNKTSNLSYNTVFSNLGPGGMFEGFRYANLDDIGTLFADANIPDIDQTTTANFQPVSDFMQHDIGQLFGSAACFCEVSEALNAQSLATGTHSFSVLETHAIFSGTAIRADGQANDNVMSPYTGSFIIRDTASVPEPRSFALLIGAALGALYFRRYRGAPKA